MVYLDNAATTFPKPEVVYEAMDKMNREGAVNAGRGSYKLAQAASKLISETKRLEFSLGQKFRYFIHDGVSKIKIICHENPEAAIDVAPNDPLFLMDDNCVLCDPAEPKRVYKAGQNNNAEAPFELYTARGTGNGEVNVPIEYYDKNGNIKSGSVVIRFSIVKDKFYDETAFPKGSNPGNYALGKHAARMEGISVIRARREIDFRRFDFYNVVNEPQHRWWGCEIVFEPDLDEVFGVANNKQYVELKKVDVEELDPEERDVSPVWDQLAKPTSFCIVNA